MNTKRIFKALLALSIVSCGLTACGDSESSDNSSNSDNPGYTSSTSTDNGCGSSGDNSPITVTARGIIDENLDNDEIVDGFGQVTFNHFPNTLAQFEEVLPTLKETPQGAVVAQLMAMELYRRNRTDGEKAFRLCNVASNVQMIMERVPDLFGYTGAIYGGDDYARPYQVASFLQGATRDNGYTPDEPYTVTMNVSVNGGQYSEIYQAKVIYLMVDTNGTDQGYRACEVIKTDKPGEPSGWIIFNCPGLYTQCKAVSYSTPFKGLK